MIDTGFGRRHWRPPDHRGARLPSIDKVFSALDGKGTVAATHYGTLRDATVAADEDGRGETDYFSNRLSAVPGALFAKLTM